MRRHDSMGDAFRGFASACSVALALAASCSVSAQTAPAAGGGAAVGNGGLSMQSGNTAPEQQVFGDVRSPNRLSIVQLCTTTNPRCNLAFVDTRDGEDAAAMVREYFRRTDPNAAIRVTSQVTCAGGWIARIVAEQGTVEGGGVMQGQAAVCGYASADAAIKAMLNICDTQLIGGCRGANRISVVWGNWDGLKPNGGAPDSGRPYETATASGGVSCVSALPLAQSASCPAAAVALLRGAGLP